VSIETFGLFLLSLICITSSTSMASVLPSSMSHSITLDSPKNKLEKRSPLGGTLNTADMTVNIEKLNLKLKDITDATHPIHSSEIDLANKRKWTSKVKAYYAKDGGTKASEIAAAYRNKHQEGETTDRLTHAEIWQKLADEKNTNMLFNHRLG
jgi:hypothetical protein